MHFEWQVLVATDQKFCKNFANLLLYYVKSDFKCIFHKFVIKSVFVLPRLNSSLQNIDGKDRFGL